MSYLKVYFVISIHLWIWLCLVLLSSLILSWSEISLCRILVFEIYLDFMSQHVANFGICPICLWRLCSGVGAVFYICQLGQDYSCCSILYSHCFFLTVLLVTQERVLKYLVIIVELFISTLVLSIFAFAFLRVCYLEHTSSNNVILYLPCEPFLFSYWNVPFLINNASWFKVNFVHIRY